MNAKQEAMERMWIKAMLSIRGSGNALFQSVRGAPWTVLTAIATSMNSEGKAWMPILDIADITGYSIRQVERIIKRLVSLGAIIITQEVDVQKKVKPGKKKRLHNTYAINPLLYQFGLSKAKKVRIPKEINVVGEFSMVGVDGAEVVMRGDK